MSGKNVVRIKEARVRIEAPMPSDLLELLCSLHSFLKKYSKAYYVKHVNTSVFRCGEAVIKGLDAEIQADGYRVSLTTTCNGIAVEVVSDDPKTAVAKAGELASFLAMKLNARVVGKASGSDSGNDSGGSGGSDYGMYGGDDDDDEDFLDDEDEEYV